MAYDGIASKERRSAMDALVCGFWRLVQHAAVSALIKTLPNYQYDLSHGLKLLNAITIYN
jgi:hypothetical protein